MNRKHALGIVVKDRWDLTQKTLQSLYHSDQIKDSYDLFIIDNGSTEEVSLDLKAWTQSSIVPVKNLIKTNGMGIGPAWNLFLALTTDYPYRTKLDNDLIFANTPVADKPFERSERGLSYRTGEGPGDVGINPGAIPTASTVMGAGHRTRKTANNQNHTCFLQHLEDNIRESSLGICALPPVSPGQTLVNTMPRLASVQWRGHPVLYGGCMMITKQTFETLGYFDDILPRHIDWEYAQRAMAHGINIGYTPQYCVIHLGEASPTVSVPQFEQNEITSKMIGSKLELKREFVHTKWEKVRPKILKALSKSMVVNLT